MTAPDSPPSHLQPVLDDVARITVVMTTGGIQAVDVTDSGRSALTESKIIELRRDKVQLEQSIQIIQKQLSDAEDWLFQQMAGAGALSGGHENTQGHSSKSLYRKKVRDINHTQKLLRTRLDETLFILKYLETHGLPDGVDPKEHIGDLLKRRRADPSSTEIKDLVNPPDPPVVSVNVKPPNMDEAMHIESPVYSGSGSSTSPTLTTNTSARSKALTLPPAHIRSPPIVVEPQLTNSARATRLKPIQSLSSINTGSTHSTASTTQASGISATRQAQLTPAKSSHALPPPTKSGVVRNTLKPAMGSFVTMFRRGTRFSQRPRSHSDENLAARATYDITGSSTGKQAEKSLHNNASTACPIQRLSNPLESKSKGRSNRGSDSTEPLSHHRAASGNGVVSSDIQGGSSSSPLRKSQAGSASSTAEAARSSTRHPPEGSASASIYAGTHDAVYARMLTTLMGGEAGTTSSLVPSSSSSHSSPPNSAAYLLAPSLPVLPPGFATDWSLPLQMHNVAMAMFVLHTNQQARLDTLTTIIENKHRELQEEVTSLLRDVLDIQAAANSTTADLEAQKRDMQTKDELQGQKLANAVARLESLDSNTEEWHYNLKQQLDQLSTNSRTAMDALQYQLVTKTRDLDDAVTTVGNKVTNLENSMDRNSWEQTHDRQIMFHSLADLAVSLFAFITSLIQVLMRFLNAGATVTHNRTLATVLNVTLLLFLIFVFWAEPLARWWSSDHERVPLPD